VVPLRLTMIEEDKENEDPYKKKQRREEAMKKNACPARKKLEFDDETSL
jgi:hypothetical protein